MDFKPTVFNLIVLFALIDGDEHHHHHHQNHHRDKHNHHNTAQKTLDDNITYTDYLITIYSSSPSKPCLYFSENRFSQPDLSLINCTWYKSNSCCKRTEVAAVFLTMFTLYRASKHCMDLMNYMMCFFCSPDQYVWYRGTQVLICSSFCNEVYDSCKTAEFGGKRIGDEYKNGHDFCKSQDFKVAENNQQCFSFDPTPFSSTHRPQSSHIAITTLLTCSLLFNKLL